MTTFAALLAIFYLSGQAISKATPNGKAPVAITTNGSYYGAYNAEYDQDIFSGVPYAQPPVGDLRFGRPQSLNTSWSGLRNATTPGFSCIGYGPESYMASPNREDCLNLMVIRPAREEKPLPVLVWIHGSVVPHHIVSVDLLTIPIAAASLKAAVPPRIITLRSSSSALKKLASLSSP
jgi:triacylglycerol lipase